MSRTKMKKTIFWFRRDLRLIDNIGLSMCRRFNKTVQCIFIFDDHILSDLNDKKDRRVTFIYEQVIALKNQLIALNSDLTILHGQPLEVIRDLLKDDSITRIVANEDYEPYGIKRDKEVQKLCNEKHVDFNTFSDHVIFHPSKILKNDGSPYQVYTAYKNKWIEHFQAQKSEILTNHSLPSFLQVEKTATPLTIESIGFENAEFKIPEADISDDNLIKYDAVRDFPGKDTTSKIGPHLRFGTISIRSIVKTADAISPTYLSELIWREFFMMLLYHFPETVNTSFKKQYEKITWRNNETEFKKWCNGETGYPIVDAGMRQLNETGFMHNRVRMITASFLVKHLLIDWRWGEAYFAEKLNDFELSSNIGNWQWVAGCGCDAAPYFRIFNPETQQKKFDPKQVYINRWNPNFLIPPMVDHKFARERCIDTYNKALGK